jgi:amino acid transporter
MQDMDRVARLSGWLYWVSVVLLVGLPLVVVIQLAKGWADPSWLAGRFAGLPDGTRVTAETVTGVILLGALTLIPTMVAFRQMMGLFTRYRRGEILSDACATHILRVGQALIVLAALKVLVHTGQILILTAANPPGQRQLVVAISDDTLWLMLAGALFVAIGWVMREAARVAEENEGFV